MLCKSEAQVLILVAIAVGRLCCMDPGYLTNIRTSYFCYAPSTTSTCARNRADALNNK